jgi:hypothetical protein
MGSDDLLILLVAVPIGAYFLIPEFKQQVDAALGGGGGGGGESPTPDIKNAPLGVCFQSGGANCWRNNRCGGGQVSLCGKESCDKVRADWIARFACKQNQPNCTMVAGNACWRSIGCATRTSKPGYLSVCVPGGTCATAAKTFVAKFPCGAKYAKAYLAAEGYTHNPTENRISV